MEFLEFIKQNYPQAIEEYDKFTCTYVPAPGSKVLTLRAGFGGYAGISLKIDSYEIYGYNPNDVYISLSRCGSGYGSKLSEWYKDFKLIEGEYITIEQATQMAIDRRDAKITANELASSK